MTANEVGSRAVVIAHSALIDPAWASPSDRSAGRRLVRRTTMSQLTFYDALTFPALDGVNNTSTLTFIVPSGVDSFSFHVYYDVSRFPGIGGYLQLQLKAPDEAKVPNVGQPFLYDNLRACA